MSGYGHGVLKYDISGSFFKLNYEMLQDEHFKLSEGEREMVERNYKLIRDVIAKSTEALSISSSALREVLEKIVIVRTHTGKFVKLTSKIKQDVLEKLILMLDAASYVSEGKKFATIKKRLENV